MPCSASWSRPTLSRRDAGGAARGLARPPCAGAASLAAYGAEPMRTAQRLLVGQGLADWDAVARSLGRAFAHPSRSTPRSRDLSPTLPPRASFPRSRVSLLSRARRQDARYRMRRGCVDHGSPRACPVRSRPTTLSDWPRRSDALAVEDWIGRAIAPSCCCSMGQDCGSQKRYRSRRMPCRWANGSR